jgi:hypothetical protein
VNVNSLLHSIPIYHHKLQWINCSNVLGSDCLKLRQVITSINMGNKVSTCIMMGQGQYRSVGIVTCYGLDSPGSNPGGGALFCTHPDRLSGPPSLLDNGHWVSFPGVQWPGRGVNHPPTSSAKVKERVQLYLHSPSGSSWPVLGRTLPLPLPYLYYDMSNILQLSSKDDTWCTIKFCSILFQIAQQHKNFCSVEVRMLNDIK